MPVRKVQLKREHWLVTGILLLCLAGAWISGELVRQHAGAKGGVLARICSAVEGAGVSCAGALDGRFSELRIPLPRPTADLTIVVRTTRVPVAFLGLAYFVFFGAWYLVAGHGRPWHRLPLHVAYTGLALSAFYLGVMAVGASPWCLGCVAVHTINALLVVSVWRLARAAPASGARVVTHQQALAALAVALVLVGGLWLYRRDNLLHRAERQRLQTYQTMVASLQDDPAFLMREYFAQPLHEIPLRETEVTPDGHPRLVVFTDFQCPACFCYATIYHRNLVDMFGGNLTIHVRHYPLCRDCNRDVSGAPHPDACPAALAAEAARRLGGDSAFRQMYDLLFACEGEFGEGTYRALAARIGLDPDRLLAEMASDQTRRIVAADVELARRLGVAGTPTMFLDGRRITPLLDIDAFWRAYARANVPTSQRELARD